MSLRVRLRIIMLSGIVLGAGFIGLVHFSDAFRLEAVTLDAAHIEDWPERFPVLQSRSIARQPLDSLAHLILADDDIFRVDIEFSDRHTLSIETNRFVPECFLLDRASGKLYGLDANASLLPLDNATPDWERPVLTGVTAGRRFEPCADPGVRTIIGQLADFRRSHRDMYRLLEEIHIETDGSLTAFISGLHYRLRLTPERFSAGLGQYLEFTTRFDSDLDNVALVDLRYDNMVVTRGDR